MALKNSKKTNLMINHEILKFRNLNLRVEYIGLKFRFLNLRNEYVDLKFRFLNLTTSVVVLKFRFLNLRIRNEFLTFRFWIYIIWKFSILEWFCQWILCCLLHTNCDWICFVWIPNLIFDNSDSYLFVELHLLLKPKIQRWKYHVILYNTKLYNLAKKGL